MTAPLETKTQDRNVERAIAWVRAIESGQTGDAIADFVTPDVVHEDMPNRFFPAGDELRARVALFMEFRDGRICRQRDYCCYEPTVG